MFSADFTRVFNKKTFVVTTREELVNYYSLAMEKNQEVMIQAIIPGKQTDVMLFHAYYDESSHPQAMFLCRRLRSYPTPFGFSCYLERVDIPHIAETVTTVVKQSGYVGLIDAEFIKDSSDGTYKLIEINPRVWMNIGFPSAYRINFAYLCYCSTLGKRKGGKGSPAHR